MIARRRLLLGSAGLLLNTALGTTGRACPSDAASHVTDALVALPGKRPLIRRTFRPPNFETPLSELRQPFTANDAFFVRYHLALIPQIDPQAWRLRVAGESARRPLELSLEDLRRDFEHVDVTAICQCSGNRRGMFSPRVPGVQWGHGAMGNARWTGVRLRDVLDRCGIRAGALEVVFDGADSALLPSTPDYVKSLPVERALDENTLIAFEMNGEPLPHWNGAPARLVVPGWTATYWIKHLTDIRIEPRPFDGFWMKDAYRVPASVFPGARFASQETSGTTPITEILVSSLVTSHRPGERIERGRPTQITGWAWDGGSGIAAVEISTDGKRTWRNAELGPHLGRFAWRGFRWPLDTSRTGPIEVAIRARSRSGALQPDRLTANPSGYHHNCVQSLTLEVV